MINRIIARAGFDPSDDILEVGPGLGALTLPLARRVNRIFAVEKDARLVEALHKKLIQGDYANVELFHEDILHFDFNGLEMASPRTIQVIGNLPYNISSPFIEKLITHRTLIGRAVLMFQAELADRLLAVPGTRAYGSLTVVLRYFAAVSPVLKVPREAFYPKPKVSSMVIDVDFGSPHPRRASDDIHFRRIVKGAFAHKRKTLLNSLTGCLEEYSREDIRTALETCEIDPGKRAEMLDIDHFLSLSSALISLS